MKWPEPRLNPRGYSQLVLWSEQLSHVTRLQTRVFKRSAPLPLTKFFFSQVISDLKILLDLSELFENSTDLYVINFLRSKLVLRAGPVPNACFVRQSSWKMAHDVPREGHFRCFFVRPSAPRDPASRRVTRNAPGVNTTQRQVTTTRFFNKFHAFVC